MTITLSPVRQDWTPTQDRRKAPEYDASEMYDAEHRIVTFSVEATEDETGYTHEERAFVAQRPSGEFVVVLDNDVMTEYEEWDEYSTLGAAAATANTLLAEMRVEDVEKFFEVAP